jgi:hypothetical protein
LAYVFDGSGNFAENADNQVGNHSLLLFGAGDQMKVTTTDSGVRFLLISGLPLHEPVAWYGPIVMNTQEELNTAVQELQNDTFIKYQRK